MMAKNCCRERENKILMAVCTLRQSHTLVTGQLGAVISYFTSMSLVHLLWEGRTHEVVVAIVH